MGDTQKSLLTYTVLCFCGPLFSISWRSAVRNICLFGTHPQKVSPKSKSCNHVLKKEKARTAVSFKTHDSGDASTQVLPDILLPKALSQERAILSDLGGSKQVQGSH